jgi:hypothetical protein
VPIGTSKVARERRRGSCVDVLWIAWLIDVCFACLVGWVGLVWLFGCLFEFMFLFVCFALWFTD